MPSTSPLQDHRTTKSQRDEEEISLFKTFLRHRTMHPNPNLECCVEWLRGISYELGMSCSILRFVQELPVVILTLPGQDPSLPSLGLNCHMDVVPVIREKWDKLPDNEDPFTAWEDPRDEKIYARGSQDMKCVGAQYLCAIKRLRASRKEKSSGLFLRTIHTIWVPDEEIGGQDGMSKFVNCKQFKDMNLGCVLDEGLAFEEDKFVVFKGERTSVWAKLTAEGPVGHGSKLIPGTAIDRLSRAMERLTAARDRNVKKLASSDKMRLGDVTTFNITVMKGFTSNDDGKTFAPNVIPPDAFIIVDIRITLEDYKSTIEELKSIAKEYQLTISFDNFDESLGPSPTSDSNSCWLGVIRRVIKSTGVPLEEAIFPAATDSRYIRRAGVTAFGFSPMRKTPSLLHDHNEYLDRKTFLEGVDVYERLVQELANMPIVHSKM
eukprot:Tbor_TRINITY_DN1553_c0_g1::TRINITY_DN1553_c0_g1_i1::g.10063::m.10063/K14677/ACY1; aminoacylase